MLREEWRSPQLQRIREKKHSPADGVDNLFWFIHLSDIHISHHGDGRGAENLADFLTTSLRAVKPRFVVATGDLTDAKGESGILTEQSVEEWQEYQSLLKKSGLYDRGDFWFDLRGNHDCFDVPSSGHSKNLFAQYSRSKESSYGHIFSERFGKYGIIAVDGAPEVGSARPFNFFGILTSAKMDSLVAHLDHMESGQVDHVFVIAHYPIVTLRFERGTRPEDTFPRQSRRFSAFLSGHLHRLVGGLGDELYSLKPTGFLDLEVGDMKDNRMYRIIAVDHDMISFVDTNIDQKVAVIVTNPKNAAFHLAHHEDISAIERSTHIRVLIFAVGTISSCVASIGGHTYSMTQSSIADSPLWTAPWNPADFSSDVHIIVVTVTDSEGGTYKVQQPFSIDGTLARGRSFGERVSLLRSEVWIKRTFWMAYTTLLCLFLVPLVYSQCAHATARALLAHSSDLLSPLGTIGASWGVFRFIKGKWISILAWLSRRTIVNAICELPLHEGMFRLLFMHAALLLVCPAMITVLTPSDRVLSFVYLWGIWRYDEGWTRILDTWACYTAFLAVQILPSTLIIALALHLSPRSGSGEERAIPIKSTQGVGGSGRRFSWLKGALAILLVGLWWVLCFWWLNLRFIRSHGLYTAIFGFAFFWHFAFTTGIMLSFTRKATGRLIRNYQRGCSEGEESQTIRLQKDC